MVYFGLFLLEHMFIKKEESEVLILQWLKYICKLISTSFWEKECICLSIVHTQQFDRNLQFKFKFKYYKISLSV